MRLITAANAIRAEHDVRLLPLRIARIAAGAAWIEGENFVRIRQEQVEDARLILHFPGPYQGAERLKELLDLERRRVLPEIDVLRVERRHLEASR